METVQGPAMCGFAGAQCACCLEDSAPGRMTQCRHTQHSVSKQMQCVHRRTNVEKREDDDITQVCEVVHSISECLPLQMNLTPCRALCQCQSGVACSHAAHTSNHAMLACDTHVTQTALSLTLASAATPTINSQPCVIPLIFFPAAPPPSLQAISCASRDRNLCAKLLTGENDHAVAQNDNIEKMRVSHNSLH